MNAQPLAAVAAEIEVREPRDWHSIFDGMSEVQKKVHLLFRRTEENVEEWREKLLRESRETYEETLREEVRSIGCGDPGPLYLGAGRELRGLNDRAKFASTSIVNTWNWDLANKIVAIRNETPTANRWVYAYRIQQWEPQHWAAKGQEIAMTETGWAVNRAKQDFYRHNDVDLEGAEVRPYRTACPVCASYVAGNPYKSMDDGYRKTQLPAHPKCPHYLEAVAKKLTADDCKSLWLGE